VRANPFFKTAPFGTGLVAIVFAFAGVNFFGLPPAWCFIAIKSAPTFVVKACFRSSRDIYVNGFSPLTAAIVAGRPDVVAHLVSIGYNVNQTDQMGYSPLMTAVYSPEMTEVLLSNGAGPNQITDPSGYTPVMGASSRGQMESFELLLQRGADIQFISPADGRTALMHAAESGQQVAVERLLKSGADPSIRSKKGLTALHYALIAGRDDIAKLIEPDAVEIDRVKLEMEIRMLKARDLLQQASPWVGYP
jgi:uncharacterized protein